MKRFKVEHDDYDVPIFYEEDPDARFERHMKAIRGEK